MTAVRNWLPEELAEFMNVNLREKKLWPVKLLLLGQERSYSAGRGVEERFEERLLLGA